MQDSMRAVSVEPQRVRCQIASSGGNTGAVGAWSRINAERSPAAAG